MERLSRALVAEFVATFGLVFIGAGAVILSSTPGPGGLPGGIIGVALAHGLILAIMISVTAHISGGHVNPAVTISLWVTGKVETVRAGAYIGAQLAGAIFAALLLRLVIPSVLWKTADLGAPLVNHTVGMTNAGAVALEAIMTFFLVFAVFGTIVDKRGPFSKLAGFPIGLVIAVDIFVGGILTGAAMNPARAFGPELVAGNFSDWWVYWVGPIAGSVIAALVYWMVFLRPREEEEIVVLEAEEDE